MNWVKIVDEDGRIWMFNLNTISQVNQEDDGTWTVYTSDGVRIIPVNVASKLADLIFGQVPGQYSC